MPDCLNTSKYTYQLFIRYHFFSVTFTGLAQPSAALPKQFGFLVSEKAIITLSSLKQKISPLKVITSMQPIFPKLNCVFKKIRNS